MMVEQVTRVDGAAMWRALTEHMLPLEVDSGMRLATSVASRGPLARVSLVFVFPSLDSQVMARRLPQPRLQGRKFSQALVDLVVCFIQTWRAMHVPVEHMIQAWEDEFLLQSPMAILPSPEESDLHLASPAFSFPSERVLFETHRGRLLVHGPLLGACSDLLGLVCCDGEELV